MKKLIILTLFLYSVLPSFSMERRLSVYEICQNSDLIFYGEVTKIESRWNSSRTMIFSEVTFRETTIIYSNERSLQSKSGEIKLLIPGGMADGSGISVSGNPVFDVDHEYLVMTKDDGIPYANPIVGGSQGLFKIMRDAGSGQKYLLSSGDKVINFDSLGFSIVSGSKVSSIQNGVTNYLKDATNRINTDPVCSDTTIRHPGPGNTPPGALLNPIRIDDFTRYIVTIALKHKYIPQLMKEQGLNSPAKSYWNNELGIIEKEKMNVVDQFPGPLNRSSDRTVEPAGNNTKTTNNLSFSQGISNAATDGPAGGALGACGYQDLYLVMEEVPSTWWSYGVNEDCMAQWNLFMDIYRVAASNGTYGWPNGVNEFAGWPSDADLFAIYGFHWNGALGMTIYHWNCSCCEILESDVCYNPAFTWTDDFDFSLGNSSVIYYKSVDMHELGHTWGFMDGIYTETYDYDYNTVMQPYYYWVVENGYGIHMQDAYLIRAQYSGQSGIISIADVGVESYYASNGLNNSWTDQASYVAGEAITINNITVENMSNTSLSNVRIRFYLSSNNIISTGDYQCGGSSEYWQWSTFAANNYSVYDYNTYIPATIPAGQYYVGAIVTINVYENDNYTPNNATYLYDKICIVPSQPGTISGPTPICQNTTNTYSIPAVSGATSYTWTLPSGWSGSSTSTSINATANSNGGTIYVKAYNSYCGFGQSQSKSVTVIIKPTITGTTPGSRCGTGTVVLGATASAGTINWYAASTGGSSLGTGTSFTTPTISATTTYYVDATTSGCTSVSRTAVTATVKTIPTITSATPGSRCGPGTVTLGATASAGTINWYSSPAGGSSLGTGTSFTTPSISVTTTYYVDATFNGCTSLTRTSVTATVKTTPTITGTSPGYHCGAGTVVLGATASAGTINWYAASTGGSSLGTGTSFTTPSISVTTTFHVDATSNGCTTASRTPVTATVKTIPTITGTTPGSRCGAGTVLLGATSSAGTINWYEASTGGSSLGTGPSFTTPSIAVTTTYYVDATFSGCTTVSRTPVTATVNILPAQLLVTNVTVTSGQSMCYNALQTITVAGAGASFIIQAGGSATMIAGQMISYLAGARVYSGAYMHGYLTTSPCCGDAGFVPEISVNQTGIGNSDELFIPALSDADFKIYPNPTSGKFILELHGELASSLVNVEVFGMRGEKISTIVFTGERKREFSLSDRPAGVYYIRVISGNKAATRKIIKQ